MQKLVVLKLDGDLAQGVRVTLEIGEEDHRPATEVRGDLPPKPEMVTHYDCWQSTYRSLGDLRLTPIGISIGGSRTEQLKNCRQLGDKLSKHLNSWLRCESFRPLKEKLLKQLTPDDTVRVLIKTDDIWLRRLPWYGWDLFEDYSQAEVALSVPEYENLPKSKTATSTQKVKILAILGNSSGIFIEKDRELLEKLPDAETTFLVEPQRSQLSEQLWEQDWDILFFAGHSSSQDDGKIGEIYINETDRLTIDELKYALKKAVSRGLQLAIFNSCDGLGLAHQLEELYIPQIIVMREPVQDLVAQQFLKNFLSKFSGGESLYLAVRESRERLHGIEDEYPCASWLPVICQNPAVVPPTWKELRDKTSCVSPLGDSQRECHSKGGSQKEHRQLRTLPQPQPKLNFKTVLMISFIVTSLLMGVRWLGLLQTWELQALDQLMRLRPLEKQDKRILVVGITEEDFQLPEQQHRKGSLSDLALARLLEKLESYEPRAIGLDIYRDFPLDAKYADLATRLQQSVSVDAERLPVRVAPPEQARLFAICEVSEANQKPGIAPPPEIPRERQGFSDFAVDPGRILRRHLIAMEPSSTSPCTTPYALSAQLAFHYLQSQGISVDYTQQGYLQLGKVVFEQLRSHMGGYQQIDDAGYQILLNYRSSPSPKEVVEQVSLKDVLTGKVNPDAVKNRIILIGVTAQSAGDNFFTPYGNEMPGVIVHAQMVSQILSAVLDGRPLLWVLPFWGEVFWVWSWSCVGGIIAWRLGSTPSCGLASGVALLGLYGFCYCLLIQGCWIPLVPSAFALIVTGGSVVILRPQFNNSSLSYFES